MGVAMGGFTLKDLKKGFQLEDDALADTVRYGMNINTKDASGRTAMHHAADYGRVEILDSMIRDQMCDPKLADKQGRQCIHIAAIAGHAGWWDCSCRSTVDINVQEDKGWTALHLAARYGHTECVKQLV